MKSIKVEIETEQVKDRLIVKCRENCTIKEFLEQAMNIYKKWHHPLVYNLEVRNCSAKNVSEIDSVKVYETDISRNKKVYDRTRKDLMVKVHKQIHQNLSRPYLFTFVTNGGWKVVPGYYGQTVENMHINGVWRHIRSNYPMNHGKYYFEIDVDKYVGNNKYGLIIGLASYKFRNELSFKPGKYTSIGYRDDGIISHAGHKNTKGHKYEAGDTIGILIQIDEEKVQFYKNRKLCTTVSNFSINRKDGSYYVSVSTKVQGTKCTIRSFNSCTVGSLKFLEKLNLAEDYEKTEKEIEDWKYKLSKEYGKKIVEQQQNSELLLWDPQFTHMVTKCVSFDRENVEFDGVWNNGIYCRTLKCFRKDLYFVEMDIQFNDRFEFGLIKDSYDNRYENIPNNIRYSYFNSGHKRVGRYGDPYFTGDRVGIFYDGEVGTVEFFVNGISQGPAYKGVIGTHYIFVLLNNIGDKCKIVNCNLDKYFEYKYNVPADMWHRRRSENFDFVSNLTVKSKGCGGYAVNKVNFSAGRRYFEVACKDTKGNISLGLCRGNNESNHYYTFQFEEKTSTTLGILVDFEDRKIDFMVGRKLKKAITYESNFPRMNCFIRTDECTEGEFTLVENVEGEVKEQFILYD